jgi:plastocyanin
MGGDTIEWANADFVAHTATAQETIPVAVKKQHPFRTAGRRAKRGAWDGSLSGNLLGRF